MTGAIFYTLNAFELFKGVISRCVDLREGWSGSGVENVDVEYVRQMPESIWFGQNQCESPLLIVCLDFVRQLLVLGCAGRR